MMNQIGTRQLFTNSFATRKTGNGHSGLEQPRTSEQTQEMPREQALIGQVQEGLGDLSILIDVAKNKPDAEVMVESRRREGASLVTDRFEQLDNGNRLYTRESSFLGTGWFKDSSTVVESPNGTLTILE
jgi:hypothetical protein